MEGKIVRATTISGKPITGAVELVYSDALASGNSEYVLITQLLVKLEGGECHVVRPRDVIEIVE